jgi:hypothetical protein
VIAKKIAATLFDLFPGHRYLSCKFELENPKKCVFGSDGFSDHTWPIAIKKRNNREIHSTEYDNFLKA